MEQKFCTYLAPCLPPLLGFINTANGCVPRRGEICKDNELYRKQEQSKRQCCKEEDEFSQ